MSTSGSRIIDLDASPLLPEGLVVKKYVGGGQFEFDPAKIILYLDEGQLEGSVIIGYRLVLRLERKPVFNANLLDYLLANPHLIPRDWEGKVVYFWGTIYYGNYGDYGCGDYVRGLIKRDGQWRDCCICLDHAWGDSPAAILAAI